MSDNMAKEKTRITSFIIYIKAKTKKYPLYLEREIPKERKIINQN